MKKLKKILNPSDQRTLLRTEDIAKTMCPSEAPLLLERIFQTGEPLGAIEVEELTESLNVARWYAMSSDATQEAIWELASNSRKRIRREVRRRAKTTLYRAPLTNGGQ